MINFTKLKKSLNIRLKDLKDNILLIILSQYFEIGLENLSWKKLAMIRIKCLFS
jgi:hypothetical protein